ncbi:5-formyltetrahydrofolate cyclo-ligase, partial [Phocaeicola barnesiae]
MKRQLRNWIKQQKKQYSPLQLTTWSTSLLDKLIDHPRFREAQTVLLYYSLPDEVRTHEFVERISQEKQVVLPVVTGDELELRRYSGKTDLKKGSFGIDEPTGEIVTDFS